MASSYNEFHLGELSFLKSYDNVVAKWNAVDQVLTLGRDWDYSPSTIRHIGIFMGNHTNRPERGRDQLKKAIDNGMIRFDYNMK